MKNQGAFGSAKEIAESQLVTFPLAIEVKEIPKGAPVLGPTGCPLSKIMKVKCAFQLMFIC